MLAPHNFPTVWWWVTIGFLYIKDILSVCTIYGRTHLDGYLTKKLGIFALLYIHIVDYSTTLKSFNDFI